MKDLLCVPGGHSCDGNDVWWTLQEFARMLRSLREANFVLSSKKCHLFQTKVKYLSHVVSSEGIAVDPKKVEVIQHRPRPVDRYQLKSFLGLRTYYRPCVPMSTSPSLLFVLLKGNEAWFRTLVAKRHLTSASVLSYPPSGGSSLSGTNNNNVIKGVLSQLQNDHRALLWIALCSPEMAATI